MRTHQCVRRVATTMAMALIMVCANAMTTTAWASSCREALWRAQPDAATPSEPVVPIVGERDLATAWRPLAERAAERSNEWGAARLLAEAAQHDLRETEAGRLPQVGLTGNLVGAGGRVDGQRRDAKHTASLGVNVSGRLYDWGRLDQLAAWRRAQADSARIGSDLAREQVMLATVAAVADLSRYRAHAQVYARYAQSLDCLVASLEQIVAVDRGRGSELLQARKTRAQAELARDAAQAQVRQIGLRLEKLLGPEYETRLPQAAVTRWVPEREQVLQGVDAAPEFQQLRAQAEAAERLAASIEAGRKPQFFWSVNGADAQQGETRVSNWQAGVGVSYALYTGRADESALLAALRRAQATREQLEGLLATRRAQAAELHDAATTAFERADQYALILRDSEQVRRATIQQWAQLGRRSLFDVMSAESEHFNLQVAQVNALYDGLLSTLQLQALGPGLPRWLGLQEP